MLRSFSDIIFSYARWSLLCETAIAVFEWDRSQTITPEKVGFGGVGALFTFFSILFFILGTSGDSTPKIKVFICQLLSFVGFLPALIDFHYPNLTLTVYQRLGLLIFGLFFDFLGFYSLSFSSSLKRREEINSGFILGLISFLLTKFAFRSIDPIWNLPLGAPIFLGIGLISAILEINSPSDKKDSKAPTSNFLFSGIAWGTFLSMIYWIFTGYSILPRWLEIDPFPFGLYLIGGLGIGVLLPFPTIFNLIFPTVAFIILFPRQLQEIPQVPSEYRKLFTNELKFSGAFILAIFISAMGKNALTRISSSSYPKISLFISSLIFFLGCTATYGLDQWHSTPYGWVFRERGYEIFRAVIAILGISALFSGNKSGLPSLKTIFFVLVLSGIGAQLYFMRLELDEQASQNVFKKTPQSKGKPKSIFEPMFIDALSGVDKNGRENLYYLTQRFNEHSPNILGIINAELNRPYLGNRDLHELFRNHFAYSSSGTSPLEHTPGCLLFSKSLLAETYTHILVAPDGEVERACFIASKLIINPRTQGKIYVLNIENSDFDDRNKQIQKSIKLMTRKGITENYSPSFLLSKVNVPKFDYHDRLFNFIYLQPTLDDLDTQLAIRSRDFNLKEFTRISQESQGEIQVGKFGLKKRDEEDPLSTQQDCEVFNSTTVCLANYCGWCQFGSVGACIEGGNQYPCVHLGGDYVQQSRRINKPIFEIATNKIFDSFAQVGINASNPLKCTSNQKRCKWTLNQFPNFEILPWNSHWASMYGHQWLMFVDISNETLSFGMQTWPDSGHRRLEYIVDYLVTLHHPSDSTKNKVVKIRDTLESGNLHQNPPYNSLGSLVELKELELLSPPTLEIRIIRMKGVHEKGENPHLPTIAQDERNCYRHTKSAIKYSRKELERMKKFSRAIFKQGGDLQKTLKDEREKLSTDRRQFSGSSINDED